MRTILQYYLIIILFNNNSDVLCTSLLFALCTFVNPCAAIVIRCVHYCNLLYMSVQFAVYITVICCTCQCNLLCMSLQCSLRVSVIKYAGNCTFPEPHWCTLCVGCRQKIHSRCHYCMPTEEIGSIFIDVCRQRRYFRHQRLPNKLSLMNGRPIASVPIS